MSTMILKRLNQQGRLTIGDTLTHSERGDYEFAGVDSAGRVIAVHEATRAREYWSVDFGPDARIVPAREVRS